MNRTRFGIAVLVTLATALLVFWIVDHTYWDEVKVPMPPKGDARVNPFYAVQRFAENLGATTSWDRRLGVPDRDAVIVISSWHWSLSHTRRVTLEQWVESGGRLVVDDRLIDPDDAFETWSGIAREYPEVDPHPSAPHEEEPLCRKVQEEYDGRPSSTSGETALWLCDLGSSWLESTPAPSWALREKKGLQAVRVPIGRGSVTVINAAPFLHRALFDGEHGRVFAAATGLRRGDRVHFLSEDDYPSLLTLAWRYGAPVVVVGLAFLAAGLWRGAARFGPLAPPTIAARRSLADQIRGTGRFALHYGGGRALHGACVRALDEAAVRRITGYAALAPEARAAALHRLTGFDRESLAAAIQPGPRSATELHRTVALLEAARRQTLIRHTKVEHGTY